MKVIGILICPEKGIETRVLKQLSDSLKFIFLIGCLNATCGCVTVSLDKSEYSKDKNVEFTPPSSPFVEFDTPFVDGAWKNDHDGSSISFHTDCDDTAQTKLHQVSRQVISDMDQTEILMKKYELFNQQRALRSQVKGLLEDIPTKMEFLIFRKHKCIYILNYVSLENSFAKNIQAFRLFQQKFKTP